MPYTILHLSLVTSWQFCDISICNRLVRTLYSLSNRGGGTMKTIRFAAIWIVLFIMGALPARSRAQTAEGYTLLGGTFGAQVCMGRWVPSRDIALPGICEGPLVDVAQFTAISARQSADRLDQLLSTLTSVDQKLAVNNDQINRLIDVTVNTQVSIDQQARQIGEFLRETITMRFDALPEEILENDAFREELAKLKEDILKEVERHYLKQPAPSKR